MLVVIYNFINQLMSSVTSLTLHPILDHPFRVQGHDLWKIVKSWKHNHNHCFFLINFVIVTFIFPQSNFSPEIHFHF
jgi:hypothetical protein